ncbi:MAG: hypothetical protein NZ899_11195 [Thermoguttaceae bacterium]|nr:hypothetical protein [Thermoguttaceae bacterium]MDW8077757.1 hypothetical protein [Thermoguttaceae bacterium]
MAPSFDPLDLVRPFIQKGTTAALADAFKQQPDFCCTFFKLERLVELVEERSLWQAGGREFGLLRDEVIRRLLISGNREGWRETAIRLLQVEGVAEAPLARFINQCYHPRSPKLAATEIAYVKGLEEAYQSSSYLKEAIGRALAWLGALPENARGTRVRVLFSCKRFYAEFPTVFVPAICVSFSVTQAQNRMPSLDHGVDGIENNFWHSVLQAKRIANEICGLSTGLLGPDEVCTEGGSAVTPILNGAEAYFSFLLAYVCLAKGIPLSPYLGFVGFTHDRQRLSSVNHFWDKISASVDAGIHILFVPRSNLLALPSQKKQEALPLRLLSYDEQMDIKEVVRDILNQLLVLQKDLPFLSVSPPSPSVNHPVCWGSGLDSSPSSDDIPLAEPKKLFTLAQLGCFVECGGYDGLGSPAKMSAFNSENECFLTIFPGKNRVYRFDAFGALYEKFRSEARPLSIVWNESRREYLIGFENRQLRRFNAQLRDTGMLSLPIEPRLLACDGDDVYVSDYSEVVLRVNIGNEDVQQVSLAGKVGQLLFLQGRGCLVVSIPNYLLGLDRQLKPLWTIPHFATQATVGGSPSGEMWVALSSGCVWRIDKDNQKVFEVPISAFMRCLVVLSKFVVAGTLSGHVFLFDQLGRKLGECKLETSLYHICATEGDMLVLSTARGPTVVKILPMLTLQTREALVHEKALATLLEWEQAASSAPSLHRALREKLKRVDLNQWQEVWALQLQFAQRKQVRPALYEKIENALYLVDPFKAARICQKTTPAIIDGSNVSRHHWDHQQKGPRRARLQAILRVREKLLQEVTPTFYPVIVVVDASERMYTDDLPTLKRMIDEGEILECPSRREADALILDLVRTHRWMDCVIVSNDRRLFQMHGRMLPEANERWYDRVRVAFTINPKTLEVYFPERSV